MQHVSLVFILIMAMNNGLLIAYGFLCRFRRWSCGSILSAFGESKYSESFEINNQHEITFIFNFNLKVLIVRKTVRPLVLLTFALN